LKVNFLYLYSTILITLRKGRRLILKVSKRFLITNYGNADCCGISSAMVRSGMLDRASEKVKEVYLPQHTAAKFKGVVVVQVWWIIWIPCFDEVKTWSSSDEEFPVTQCILKFEGSVHVVVSNIFTWRCFHWWWFNNEGEGDVVSTRWR